MVFGFGFKIKKLNWVWITSMETETRLKQYPEALWDDMKNKM